jgi:gas vesicle protein
MSRTKVVMAVAGTVLFAGAAGWAAGTLCAPASGRDTRRRLGVRAEREFRTAARASRAFLGRAIERARAELCKAETQASG